MDPEETDVISIFWSCISLVSTIKSLLAKLSATLYGKVFLIKLLELKSKLVCKFLSMLNCIDFDLYELPIK